VGKAVRGGKSRVRRIRMKEISEIVDKRAKKKTLNNRGLGGGEGGGEGNASGGA